MFFFSLSLSSSFSFFLFFCRASSFLPFVSLGKKGEENSSMFCLLAALLLFLCLDGVFGSCVFF